MSDSKTQREMLMYMVKMDEPEDGVQGETPGIGTTL